MYLKITGGMGKMLAHTIISMYKFFLRFIDKGDTNGVFSSLLINICVMDKDRQTKLLHTLLVLCFIGREANSNKMWTCEHKSMHRLNINNVNFSKHYNLPTKKE